MKLEKKATLVSSSTAAVLVIMKMIVGIMSGSVAILASAVDSFLDLIVSLFNFFALHQAEKEADAKFNFGRGKLEAIAATMEGMVISLSGLFILYTAMEKLIHPKVIRHMDISIAVMGISIIITAALVLFLLYVAKQGNNLVIKADALHYKTDLFSNGAILLSLAIIHFSDIQIIDPILGILIAIYMVYSAYPIMKEGFLMLMDAALEEEDIEKITNYLNSVSEITSYHHLHTRAAGSDIFISVHLVFTVSTSLFDAHRVSDAVEDDIKALFEDGRVSIIVHMDPYDDAEINDEI